MCYLCGHVLVVHDIEAGVQRKLQGHKNAINCLKTSPDKSLICTADSGYVCSRKPSLSPLSPLPSFAIRSVKSIVQEELKQKKKDADAFLCMRCVRFFTLSSSVLTGC